ncbi:MAG: ABC transporter permease [Oscillospiraceae bacterium]
MTFFRQVLEFTRRSLKIFLRDRSAVFFAIMSMLVVIGLMVIFLGDMNVNAILSLLEEYGGARNAESDRDNAELLVLMWTISGIISINAVTVTLSAISVMIEDKTSGRFNSFSTAPISRCAIALGYIIAAWAASVIICLLTLAVSEAYACLCGAEPFSLAVHLKLAGMICANSFTYASMMYFFAILTKSSNAWSGLGTIIGTLVGFLGGIYLPIGSLGESIGTMMKCLPVIYGTSMFRTVCTEDIVNKTFEGLPAEITDIYRSEMGITLSLGEHSVGTGMDIAILLGCGVLFILISAAFLGRKSASDR